MNRTRVTSVTPGKVGRGKLGKHLGGEGNDLQQQFVHHQPGLLSECASAGNARRRAGCANCARDQFTTTCAVHSAVGGDDRAATSGEYDGRGHVYKLARVAYAAVAGHQRAAPWNVQPECAR